MRKNIVAGNWKMNNDFKQTKSLLKDIRKGLRKDSLKNKKVIVAPSFVNLHTAVKVLGDSKIKVAAQNMNAAQNGAFTGEISAEMLKSIDIKTVILGHSERRALFGENDVILKAKVDSALEQKMKIIFCFGEELNDRKENNHFTLVESQIKNALFHLPETSWSKIVLAYEPVWAIGTGETASPEQAQEMHAFIRKTVEEQYTEEIANNVSILYGGSVKPANAKEIFSKPDVDGGLIGGAALKAADFLEIIAAI
jgi:triosephosphate isomerase|tara:strand:- start:2515 stop:3273 length:759 start_codon:yes stop_codon:yes gene_type:complete